MPARTTGHWLYCDACYGSGDDLEVPMHKSGTCEPCTGRGFIFELWPCFRKPDEEGWAEHKWVAAVYEDRSYGKNWYFVSNRSTAYYASARDVYCGVCGVLASEAELAPDPDAGLELREE